MAISSTRLDNLVGNFTRTINTDTAAGTRSVSLTNGNITREKSVATLPDGGATRTVSFTGPKATRETTVTTDGQGGTARTASLSTEKFSREVSTSVDADGNTTRALTMTTADGKQISRERTKTVNADGTTTLSGTINGLSGVRTYVADVSGGTVSGTYTYEDIGVLKSVEFARPVKNTTVPPEPAPQPVSEQISAFTDPSMEMFGEMPVLYGAADQTA